MSALLQIMMIIAIMKEAFAASLLTICFHFFPFLHGPHQISLGLLPREHNGDLSWSYPNWPGDRPCIFHRRGSRINTDRFPSSREVRGHAPSWNFLNFNSSKYPFSFLGFLSHSDRIFTDFPNHLPDFNLESLKFSLKYIYYEKSDRFP